LSPSNPVRLFTVSFSWPGSGTAGTPVTVGVGLSRSPTIGTLGKGSGVVVGKGSGSKETEGSGTGSNPACAFVAGYTNRAQHAHTARAQRRTVRKVGIRLTFRMVGGITWLLYG
jgi:hypothetical protein